MVDRGGDGEGGGAAEVGGLARLASRAVRPRAARLQRLDQPAPGRAGCRAPNGCAGDVLHIEDVERLAARRGEDARADDVAAEAGDGLGEVGEQALAVAGRRPRTSAALRSARIARLGRRAAVGLGLAGQSATWAACSAAEKAAK